jgi:hypothetical protein
MCKRQLRLAWEVEEWEHSVRLAIKLQPCGISLVQE